MTIENDQPSERSAFDQMGMDARLETRMLEGDKPITDEQRDTLLKNLHAYRDRQKGDAHKWSEIARGIGVSDATLNEVLRGTYKADPANILRKIDQFLADEDIKLERLDIRGFVRIALTQKIKGAIDNGLKRNTMPVIIGQPGSGKTAHAQWFVSQREGAVLIEPDDFDCDERWVVDRLYVALGINAHQAHRRDKKRVIVNYLQKHKATVIVVDEAQKLTRGALEMLRRLHDLSDPSGKRNVSIVFFGDEDFYKLIVQARGGARVPLTPQITRRMFPIFDIARQGCDVDRRTGGPKRNSVYTRTDIAEIVKSQRVRIVRDDAVDWLVRLANTSGHGSLGLAVMVLETAWDIKDGRIVTIADLVLALTTVLGPDADDLIEEETEHDATAQRAVRAG
jgi:hypothetical protein